MSGEYWTPMQQLISEYWDMTDDLADELIAGGYVTAENRDQLVDLLAEHNECEADDDYDGHCKCGKWIEFGQYDIPEHLSSVLDDARLITAGMR